MRIRIVTPAPPGSRTGNRVTAERWAGFLESLGHEVEIAGDWDGETCDLLVALHARRSASAIRRFDAARPDASLVVALTGTDLYRDLERDAEARRSLEVADRIVALHPRAAEALPGDLRPKVRVVLQSVPDLPAAEHREDGFDVCVLAHLREVKDPLRAAEAARRLPQESRLRVLHAGAALEPEMAEAARREEAENPRYSWLGELPREGALGLLARCRLLVLSSRMEGGANVVSEAIAARTPLLASRIAGSIGLLGDDYPGLFAVGDTAALAELLLRAERDAAFYEELVERTRILRPLFEPAREEATWRHLLAELAATAGTEAGRFNPR